jgi:hypothetical protein
VEFLPDTNTQEEFRQRCIFILGNTTLDKRTKSEAKKYSYLHTLLNEFKTWLNSNELWLLKADKGNKYVVIEKDRYKQGVIKKITGQNYTQLPDNPINKISNETRKTIGNSALLDPNVQRSLQISAPCIPIIYGLPKIHKKEIPFRLIISGRMHPCFRLSKWLARLLG